METPATITEGGHLSPNNSDRTTDEDNKNAIFEPAAEPAAAKRPRGRPPGSKNKPKPVALVADDGFRRHIVKKVSPGADVAACLAAYARSHRCGLSVKYATGSVGGFVSFRNYDGLFKGPFTIVSLNGFIFPDDNLSCLNLVVSSNPKELIGGILHGPLIAASPVIVSATASPLASEIEDFSGSPHHQIAAAPHIDSAHLGLGPTNGPIEGPGSGFNPSFNPMNFGMANYGLAPRPPRQQHNGRHYLNTNL